MPLLHRSTVAGKSISECEDGVDLKTALALKLLMET